MERHSGLVAAALSGLLLAFTTAAVLLEPDFADRLTREDAAVEWFQTGLFALAAVFAAYGAWDRRRAGESPVFEVLMAAMLAGLVIGEVDLDRVIVGRKIISTRFLVDTRVWLGWRVLALLVLTLPPAALALYALRRWRELLGALLRTSREPPGRVVIAGVLIFGLTELFEKPLGRIPGLPRFMLEEVFELIAAICLGVGLHGYWRLRRAERNSPRR